MSKDKTPLSIISKSGIMSASSASPSYAAPPFDHPQADVILRSSNNIDFRVFKLFLSLASPVFETMFSLPQPSEEGSADEEIKNGLPIIPVSEDSKTLDSLLRFCYPCTLAEDPSLDNFREIANILAAVQKYSLDAIEKAVCKALFIPEILEVDSLRCFIVARRAGLREQCALAAKYSLREPLVPAWSEEIQLIDSTGLLSLLTYHQECATTVQVLRHDLSWIRKHYKQQPSWTSGSCGTSWSCKATYTTSGRYYDLYRSGISQWWEDFMETTFMALRDKPCGETVRTIVDATIEKMRSRDCQCHSRIAAGMHEFSTFMANEVERLTAKIQLDLRF